MSPALAQEYEGGDSCHTSLRLASSLLIISTLNAYPVGNPTVNSLHAEYTVLSRLTSSWWKEKEENFEAEILACLALMLLFSIDFGAGIQLKEERLNPAL